MNLFITQTLHNHRFKIFSSLISIRSRHTFVCYILVRMRRHNLNIVCALFKTSRNVCYRSALSRPLQVDMKARPILIPDCGSRRFYSQSSAKCWNCQDVLAADLCIQYTCLKCNSLLSVPKECVSSHKSIICADLQEITNN